MKPQMGDVWQHYKGAYYGILCIAKHTETQEDMVVYRPVDDPTTYYTRPLIMFLQEVPDPSIPIERYYRSDMQLPFVPRFKKVN